MSVWSKRIESATNVAILCAFLLVAALAAKRLVEPSPSGPHAPSIGKTVSLPQVDWSKSNRNLVLALNTGCHFCTESAGFYQKLIPSASSFGIPVIAVLPQPATDGRAYLENLHVSGAEIVQSPLSTVDVTGTPAVLIIDNKGRIQRAWVGKLGAERQQEVISSLR